MSRESVEEGKSKARILIAAPEEAWNKDLSDAFYRSGYIPHRTSTAEGASLAVCYRNPAAAIVDASLLRSAGYRLLDALRMHAPRLPILVLIDAADEEMRLKCLMMGAEDCLIRPLSPPEAILRLRRCLERRDTRRRLTAERESAQTRAERLRGELDELRSRLQRNVRQLQRAVEFHQRLEPAGNGYGLEARFLRQLALQTRINRLAYLTPVHAASSWMAVRAAWGLSRALTERLRLPAAGELVSLLESTGRPVAVDPLGTLPGLRLEAGLLAAGGMRACVPLLLQGRLLGILLLGEMEGGGTPDEETLLSAHLLASALAPALAADRGWAEERRLTARTLGMLVSRLEERSPYLKGHSLRVSRLAEGIGERLGLDPVDLSHLATSALLHDIGRFEVDAAFWSKEEPLTSEDWKLIRRHPADGARLLAEADWPEPILDAVRHHHERWDGSGYPTGLLREAIPLHARILAVADALDALTSPRPHRPALPRPDALRILHEDSGRRFDPEVVETVVRSETEEEQAAV